jgi:hypothetical protein
MSSILHHRQFRFFTSLDPESELAQRFIRLHPTAEIMFPNSYTRNKWTGQFVPNIPRYAIDGSRTGDPEMFCHEVAHCMERMRSGKAESLLVNDFGWGPVQNKGWSKRMAENEALVFALQWLLLEELGYTRRIGILNPDTTSFFLKAMTDNKIDSQYFLELYTKLDEELKPVWKDLFYETLDYLVAAVDAERISS